MQWGRMKDYWKQTDIHNNPAKLRPTRCMQKPATDGCSVAWRPALAYVDIMDSESSFKILTFYFPNKKKSKLLPNSWIFF